MIDGKKLLAVIPARSGSKRLPSKNILPIVGKPLIAWTIEEAKKSSFVDDVVVSTDDQMIANISQQYGAEVPSLRPLELAKDESSSLDAVLNVLQTLETQGRDYGYVVLLQPTSPLRTATHIDGAVSLLIDRSADSIVSVTKLEHPIEWSGELPSDLSIEHFMENTRQKVRSQDLPVRYRLNGAIYLISVSELIKESALISAKNCYAYRMPKEESIDIDERFDFEIAEMLLSKESR